MKLEPWWFALAVALSRFTFRSYKLYDIDSVNFALAINRFDPRVHQPHPPGYFLYILLARLVNLLVHDANLALVLIGIAASCGAIVLVYLLALEWFGLTEARFAALIFLFSPLGWFHGIVALTYSVEAFFSALIGYLCWRASSGSLSAVLAPAIALGISAGIRPSSILFLAPLFLYSLYRLPLSRKLAAVFMLLATLAAWVLPMLFLSGGFHSFFGAFTTLWSTVPAKKTVFNSSPVNSIARACVVACICLLMTGTAALILGCPLREKTLKPLPNAEKTRFTFFWIVPSLCFFTFVFLLFVNSGYLLLLLPPASLWLGRRLADCYMRSSLRAPAKLALIASGALINTIVFLASPLYCSYRSVREFEAQLNEVTSSLPQVASSSDTLILGFDSHFLGYRHAGYYLPEYLTIEYPAVHQPEGPRIFALHHRSTSLLAGLSQESYRRFVLFPLPNGDPEYLACVERVKHLLPPSSLQIRHIGHYDYFTGPITLLPLLFPTIPTQPTPAVYPLLHSGATEVYTGVNTLPRIPTGAAHVSP